MQQTKGMSMAPDTDEMLKSIRRIAEQFDKFEKVVPRLMGELRGLPNSEQLVGETLDRFRAKFKDMLPVLEALPGELSERRLAALAKVDELRKKAEETKAKIAEFRRCEPPAFAAEVEPDPTLAPTIGAQLLEQFRIDAAPSPPPEWATFESWASSLSGEDRTRGLTPPPMTLAPAESLAPSKAASGIWSWATSETESRGGVPPSAPSPAEPSEARATSEQTREQFDEWRRRLQSGV